MGSALDFLMHHKDKGPPLLERILTADEIWVQHCTLKTKQVSKEWHKASETATKKGTVRKSTGKLMAMVFWDAKGISHVQ